MAKNTLKSRLVHLIRTLLGMNPQVAEFVVETALEIKKDEIVKEVDALVQTQLEAPLREDYGGLLAEKTTGGKKKKKKRKHKYK